MAAYHARSNVCRAGVTYAGLSTRAFGLSIGGSSRTSDARQSVGFTIVKPLDGSPSTLGLTCGGTKPTEGQDVLITVGGELLFGGTVQRVKSVQHGQLMTWQIAATDWWWLLNRYSLVNGVFSGSINTIVHKILATYTDGGFAGGYLPSSLGSVDNITFDGVSVGEALMRLAKAANSGAGAYLRITPFKRVDIGTSFPDGLSLTLVDGNNYWRQVDLESSLDQVRTRIQAHGVGTQTTTTAAIASTTVDVDECGIFASAGGAAFAVGVGPFTYTGRSTDVGPGQLTGVSGLLGDLPQGTLVRVRTVANDTTAQTNLATLLGGGRSGVVVHRVENDAWSNAEAAAQASAHLAMLKDPQKSLVLTGVALPAAQMWRYQPGATVTASVTTPQTISGDFRIQSVTIGAFSSMAESEPYFDVAVSARSTVGVDLFDILGTAA